MVMIDVKCAAVVDYKFSQANQISLSSASSMTISIMVTVMWKRYIPFAGVLSFIFFNTNYPLQYDLKPGCSAVIKKNRFGLKYCHSTCPSAIPKKREQERIRLPDGSVRQITVIPYHLISNLAVAPNLPLGHPGMPHFASFIFQTTNSYTLP